MQCINFHSFIIILLEQQGYLVKETPIHQNQQTFRRPDTSCCPHEAAVQRGHPQLLSQLSEERNRVLTKMVQDGNYTLFGVREALQEMKAEKQGRCRASEQCQVWWKRPVCECDHGRKCREGGRVQPTCFRGLPCLRPKEYFLDLIDNRKKSQNVSEPKNDVI